MLRLIAHTQPQIIRRTNPNCIFRNILRNNNLATRKRASSAIGRIRCENIFNLRLSLTGHLNRVTRAVFRGNNGIISSCGVVVWIKTRLIQLVGSILALEYFYLVFGFRAINITRVPSLK